MWAAIYLMLASMRSRPIKVLDFDYLKKALPDEVEKEIKQRVFLKIFEELKTGEYYKDRYIKEVAYEIMEDLKINVKISRGENFDGFVITNDHK